MCTGSILVCFVEGWYDEVIFLCIYYRIPALTGSFESLIFGLITFKKAP